MRVKVLNKKSNKNKKKPGVLTKAVLAILLATAIIPDNNKVEAANAESDFTYTISAGGAIISKYVGASKSVVIPDTLGGSPVVELGNTAFQSQLLTAVTIPSTVKKIGTAAFNQNSITSVVLPTGLTSLGASAFKENNLTAVSIPPGVTTLPDYLFQYNKITSVDVPSNIISIGKSVFDANQLTSVTLHEGLKTIDEASFRGNKLTEITLPSTMTAVYGGGVFIGNQTTASDFTIRGYDSAASVKAYSDSIGHTYVSLGSVYVPPVIPPSGGTGDVKAHEATASFGSGDLTLQIPDIYSFGNIKLEAQAKLVKTGFDDIFKVIDSRGTAEGWRLDLSASRFTEVTPASGFVGGTSAVILPAGSLSILPLATIVRVGSSAGTLPTKTLIGNSIIDDGVITMSTAVAGSGMGEFNLDFTNDSLSLVVDAATAKIDKVNYPGDSTPYSSTLTWTLVSAP